MLRLRRIRADKCTSGQALLETALVLPLLLTLIFNAVNFGYFLLVALNISAAPRTGAAYSIIGYATPASPSLPSVASVTALTQADMTGALSQGATTPVVVCSKIVGISGAGTTGQVAQCSGGPVTPAADPEAPEFVLHRVDVNYSFTPIIPGTAFAILLPRVISRQVSMRALD